MKSKKIKKMNKKVHYKDKWNKPNGIKLIQNKLNKIKLGQLKAWFVCRNWIF